MTDVETRVETLCDCIDQCFVFIIWCDDFVPLVEPDDIVSGLARGFDLVSDATRLLSFLALRKVSDFFGEGSTNNDDITLDSFGIEPIEGLLEGGRFLSRPEREKVSKNVAHLTDKLSLDPDSEVELHAILVRNMPVFRWLVSSMKSLVIGLPVSQMLKRTEELLDRVVALRESVS